MRPLGKTYLIKIDDQKEEILEGGIIIPAENKNKLIHYRGKITEIGLGFNGDNLVNKDDYVIFDWKKKEGKVKVKLSQELYYIVEEPLILAVEETTND
jgi:co-chaperonin GroES (HSP10)